MEYKFLDNLKYTKTHEWVKIEDNVAIAGITDYAQHQLGDVVFIELPDKGTKIEKDGAVGEIESVKAVGEIFMPLSGEILETNQNLIDNPELLNTSPYNDGWIIRIKISNPDEIKNLLSVDDYKDLVKSEEK
ncbi:MAG: glycine cleavage system protein GcvH [Candidatus Hodarchaeota archaeon]